MRIVHICLWRFQFDIESDSSEHLGSQLEGCPWDSPCHVQPFEGVFTNKQQRQSGLHDLGAHQRLWVFRFPSESAFGDSFCEGGLGCVQVDNHYFPFFGESFARKTSWLVRLPGVRRSEMADCHVLVTWGYPNLLCKQGAKELSSVLFGHGGTPPPRGYQLASLYKGSDPKPPITGSGLWPDASTHPADSSEIFGTEYAQASPTLPDFRKPSPKPPESHSVSGSTVPIAFSPNLAGLGWVWVLLVDWLGGG